MNLIDRTGQRFGNLVVLRLPTEEDREKYPGAKEPNRKCWLCQCDCGNIVCYRTDKVSQKKSCGCLRNKREDLTGQKFGRLTVINYHGKGEHGSLWNCQCECGNTKIAYSYHLKQGRVLSCGCLAKEQLKEMNERKIIDETGNTYGFLKVLERDYNKTDEAHNIYWKCLCTNCNSITSVAGTVLRRKDGGTKSCGCILSYGEVNIAKILSDANITFEKQKSFENCRFPDSNKLAKFDFWVDNKYLIEFDGIQHTIAKGGWATPEQVEKTQKRDSYKNQWCKENNIPLIRIPYTMRDTVTLQDLLLKTTKYLIK